MEAIIFSPPDKAIIGGFPDDNVSDRLRGGIVKIFMDPVYPLYGMVRQHAHVPREQMGVVYNTQEEADSLVLSATEQGLQMAIHCIGNVAIEQALNAFEKAIKAQAPQDPRFRIEHLAFPNLAQIRRAASLGIIISHQPGFQRTIGETLEHTVAFMDLDTSAYPMRTMLDEGTLMAAGSDFPCAPIAPLTGLYSLVSRTREFDGLKIEPDQAISAMDGLKMYTRGSASAMFRDHEVGSLEKGKRADMVVLSHDPTAVNPHFIEKISVQQTYVDGDLLFERI